MGHACALVTDHGHAPLRALLKARHQSGKLARWGQMIPETTTNTHANANMASQQRVDPELKTIIEYLDGVVLPTDEKLAKRLVLERSQFSIQDGVCFM